MRPRRPTITIEAGVPQLTAIETDIAAAHQNIINFTTQNRQISTEPGQIQPKSAKTIDKKHKLCYNGNISLIEARSVVCLLPEITILSCVRSGAIWFDNGTVGGPHTGGIASNGYNWSSWSYSNLLQG